jgi:hypothetical protein
VLVRRPAVEQLRRAGADLLEAQQHDGDVVPSAGLVGGGDQRLARVTQARMGAQRGGDLLLGEHRRQAVAAQQVDVSGAGAEAAGVDLDRALGPEGTRDHRALGMLDGFLGREPPLAHQLVDERVVVGEAQQLAFAQAVGAAVADMRDCHLAIADVDGSQRRPHAGMLGVGVGELVDT